jgi:hypothetical protein
MIDDAKIDFLQAVTEFAEWQTLPDGVRPNPSSRWWHSCLSLVDSSDPLPDEFSSRLAGVTTFGAAAHAFIAQLQDRFGSVPPPGWEN